MPKILVIVESPGKIKKIQSILGSGYLVVASVGHIIDLDRKSMSVKIDEDFEPIYTTIEGKNKVINDLKKFSKGSSDVLLAADEDREGEMIAWSVAHVLKLKEPKRIVFNSITKAELLKAVKKPGQINQDMVDAQKARRILDRIVGYELSPLLRQHIGPGSLSAGRVQSVVVKLIIDKEDEITAFYESGPSSYFKFKGSFMSKDKKPFTASLHDLTSQDKDKVLKGGVSKIESADESRELLKKFMKSTFKIHNVFDKKSLRNPGAPFTTSTLQQEASRKLGFAVKRTMTAAQHLYEEGHITYMRTDSVNLSGEAIANIKKYVIQHYGENYHKLKVFKGTKGAQEAHEAVRPTDVFVTHPQKSQKVGDDEIRLYNLIWKRTVASQMQPAEFNITSIQITISKDQNHFFMTSIENLVFPGFLAVYNIANIADDEDEKEEDVNKGIKIPAVGESLTVASIVGTEDYVRPPSRFNEASLVDKLDPKNLNIGRPSTYASIISKIMDRGYVKMEDLPGQEKDSLTLTWESGTKIDEMTNKVVVGKENKKFIPTTLGRVVNEFLVKNFPTIMDYKFTAGMEEKLDKIAEGKVGFVAVLDSFYKEFHPRVVKMKTEKSTVEDKYTRVLGTHPENGAKIVATIAKYGPVVKMYTSETKPEIAPIKLPLTLEKITLQDAVKLFEYPKYLGKDGNTKIYLKRGKFGFYIQAGPKKASVQNEDITLEEAIQVFESKKKATLAEFNSEGKRYAVFDGPYGKYIRVSDLKKKTAKDFNVSLPKDVEVEELTLEKVKELVNEYFTKRKTRFKKKPASGGANSPDKKTKSKGKSSATKKKMPIKKGVAKAAKKKKIDLV